MKVILSIHMYSGVPNPEMELSPEIAQEIINKLYLANEESEVKIHHKLGFSGYLIYWEGGNGIPCTRIDVNDGIIASGSFIIQAHVKDTVGLEDYLKDLFAPTWQAHLDECQKQMEEYNKKISTEEGMKELHEEMFGTTK